MSSSSSDEDNQMPACFQGDFSSRKDAIAAIMKYYTLTVKKSVQINAKKSSGKCVVLGCTTVLTIRVLL